MGRIKMVAPLVPKGDGRRVKPERKQVDPFYDSAGHKAFRHAVLSRARYRCEWIEDGKRCDKAAP
jgi:5-methylcytosine-specific restriction enzyme A